MTIRWISPDELFAVEQTEMRYIRVQWIHQHPDEPVEMYSELDEAGWETRKVEVFRDGTIGFASSSEAGGLTELGEGPLPSLEEIASDPEFRPMQISKDEFEGVWAKRRSPIPSA